MNWRWSILWNSYFLGCDNADVVRGQVSWCFYIHIIRKTQIHGNREHGKMVAILITILDYTGVHCTVLSTFLWFWNSCDKEVGKSTINGNLEKVGEKFFSQKNLREWAGVLSLLRKSQNRRTIMLPRGHRLWKRPGRWPASSQGASTWEGKEGAGACRRRYRKCGGRWDMFKVDFKEAFSVTCTSWRNLWQRAYAPSGPWEGWLFHSKTEVSVLRGTGYQGLYSTGDLLPKPVLLKSSGMFAQGIK